MERENAEIRSSYCHGREMILIKKVYMKLFSQIATISRKLQYGLLIRHGQALETGFTMTDSLKKVPHCLSGCGRLLWTWCGFKYFGQDADVYHVKSMEDAMLEVEEGRADFAVLPVKFFCRGSQ